MGLRKRNKYVTIPDTVKQAEQIRQALVRADNLQVGPGLIKQEGPGGITIGLDTSCTSFWAKVSGSGPVYTWKEAKRLPGGTWQDCCRSGSTAIEVNGITGLNGKYQQLYPDCDGSGVMHFQDVRVGSKPPTGCVTKAHGPIADLNGVTGPSAVFCPPIGKLNYTISGFESMGGVIYPQNDAHNGYQWAVQVGYVPQGTYSLRIFSDPDICGTLRFDQTFPFKSACPTQSLDNGPFTLQAKYDIIPVTSTWGVSGCQVPTGLNPTVSYSGDSCQSQTTYSNNGLTTVSLQAKVTSYPVTYTFSGSGDNCLGATETQTYQSCHSMTSDWCNGIQPFVLYKYWPIIAYGCASSANGDTSYFLPLPNAQIAASGSFTGTAQTTGAFSGDTMEISDWKPPKCGVPWKVTWTVTHARCVGMTYDSDHVTVSSQANGIYGQQGSYCPLGGWAGVPASGFACGGCPTPLPTTLHDQTLGGTVTLTYQNKVGWVGYGSFQTLSETCDPGSNTFHSNRGSVQFQVTFSQINLNSDGSPASNNTGPLTLYSCNSAGAISQCGIIVANSRQNGCIFGIGQNGPYGSSSSVSCSPLLLQVGGTTQASCRTGTDPKDGHTIWTTYNIDIQHSITE